MEFQFNRIIEGVSGAEGPVVDLAGRFFVVEPNRGRIVEISRDGMLREHAATGGIPAGLQVDRENNLWCADMKLGVLRIEPDGALHHEVTTYQGQPIRGCNDCYFNSMGDLYFTAPAGSDENNPVGQLFCRLNDGAVRELDNGLKFCNGLAVSADDSQLVVAETCTKQLLIYDLPEPGCATNRRKLADLPAENSFGPDGMDFDIDGRLLVANFGGASIDVFDLGGKLLERVMTPFAKVTNVHFQGPKSRTLLVTECTTHGLWTTTWRTTGQLQYCDRKEA
jgi:gluconolactonase